MIQLLRPLADYDLFPTTGVYLEPRSWGPHGGIDKGANFGTPVLAMHDGEGARRDYGDTSYGKSATIHAPALGIYSRYAHMERYEDDAFDGEPVKAGDVIGYVGSTGNSTGPHLHVEGRYIATDQTFDLTPHFVDSTLWMQKQTVEAEWQELFQAYHDHAAGEIDDVEHQQIIRRSELAILVLRGTLTAVEADDIRRDEGL